MKHKGIDISACNGKYDFNKLKANGVEFVIIRLGFGKDLKSQDDKCWKDFVSGCEAAGLPYGLYLYSYALTTDNVDSEIAHALRIAKQCKPTLGIWYDMEDADQYKKKHGIKVYSSKKLLTGFCTKFCDAMKAAGYKTGIYANLDYWKNVLTKEAQKYDGWLAAWRTSEPTGYSNMVMWQYAGSEEGKTIPGSPRRGEDLDYYYGDLPQTEATKKEETSTEKSSNIDISVGSKVMIRDGAKYGGLSNTRGMAVPHWVCTKKMTVAKIATHYGEPEALISEVFSWVAVKYLKEV